MYIGIVAEWNPFHDGHAYLIRCLRSRYGPVPIASIQSGAFVQRGEPALFDKWSRAVWSIESGIDLAVELPAVCALQSADHFAAAGARLAADLGCTHLAFGTESFSGDTLTAIAGWMAEPAFHSRLHEGLDAGLPYASAVNNAIADHFPHEKEALTRPNNLLGIQYAREIARNHLPLSILTVPRDASSPASATAIRAAIAEGLTPPYIPRSERPQVESLIARGALTDYRRYGYACLAASRLLTKEQLRRSGLFSEGLENRWHQYRNAASYDEMLGAIKNKRYLYSRLRRIGASLLLSGGAFPSPMSRPGRAPYIRLLAMRREKSALLRRARLPTVTRFARAAAISGAAPYLEMECRASDMQALFFRNPASRRGGRDYYESPRII